MMLKFEGKNRAYKISNILHKEETLFTNEKYITIPIIISGESLRIFKVPYKHQRKDEKNIIEIKKSDYENLSYDVFFENQITEYLNDV